jgi:hypothetical protein
LRNIRLLNIALFLSISLNAYSQCPLPNVSINTEDFISHSQVSVHWTKNPSATNYNLDVSVDSLVYDSSTILSDYRNFSTAEDSVYIRGLIKNKTYYYRIRPWSLSCGYGNYIYDSFTTLNTSECFGSTDTVGGGFENSAGWTNQNTS